MNPNDPNFDGIHSDFENQTDYTHPRAWRDAKRAMINMANHLPQLVEKLEAVARQDKTCIRLALAAALHGYVSQTQSGRTEDLLRSLGGEPKAAAAVAPKPASTADDDAEDWEKEGEEWKRATRAPSESLPKNEQASPAEFMAAMGKAVAPRWPLPAGLPVDAHILDLHVNGAPLIASGGKISSPSWRMHCPCCGKTYQSSPAYHRHAAIVHGVKLVEVQDEK